MTKQYQTYYIPGYPGKNSSTAQLLVESDPSITVLEYDPENPLMCLQQMLSQIMSNAAHPIIAASSLGGWFAENIAARIPVDLILWNPSLRPQLHKYGIETSYKPLTEVRNSTPRTVILGECDSVVAPINSVLLYSKIAEVILLQNTEHRMTVEGLQLMLEKIEDHKCFPSENM